MREELPWLHVQRTRIYYDGGTGQVSANGNGEASASAADAAGAALTMLRGWRVSAMENGECNRASPSRQQGTLGEPMFYLRVGATMQQWRQWRKKEIGRSISLRGSDA